MRLGDLGEKLLAAFASDGKRGAATRLDGVTRELLQAGLSESRAVAQLSQAVDDDPALLLEIIDRAQLRQALLKRYVTRAAARLRADGVRVNLRRTPEGGGQNVADSHQNGAPATPSGRARAAGPPASGQRRGDSHPSRDPGRRPASQPGHSARTDLGALKRAHARVAACALDRLRVRGLPLRASLPDEATLAEAERRKLEGAQILRICHGLDPTRPVGEQISDPEADRLAEAAARAAV
jgi:hypothetical protein